jgi:hypothetical protein
MTLEKPEASTLSQASQVSSSPVKSACNPYKNNPKIYLCTQYITILTMKKKGIPIDKKNMHTRLEPCKSTRAAKSPDG